MSLRRSLTGVAPKLLGINAAVVVLVAFVMLQRASVQLDHNMTEDFESKGEAIALSLASSAEDNMGSSLSTVRDAVEANKIISGVRYIYVLNGDGQVLLQTFGAAFPKGLETANPLALGELSGEHRIKVNRQIDVLTPAGAVRAIDIAAPISGGALGSVHVGMDRALVEAQVRQLRGSLIAWGGVVALFGVVLGFFLVYWMVVRPVRELTRLTSAIVRRGDLTQPILIDSRDEIGELAESFRQMVTKLREIPRSLGDSVVRLTDSVAHLKRSTEEQNQTVTRQAVALQETQVTAQELKQTSRLAAQQADAVLRLAERADGIARVGEGAIGKSLGGLADIRTLVDQIASKIAELGERTRQIGGITETVKDLADQSNILALNAAIEAVRAGENGKGFAVVAREIRRLSDQSLQATGRVRAILEDIGGAITQAVSITTQGATTMESGLVEMRSSGQNLRELATIVQDNSASVRQIAAAVGQQDAGITQIFAAVTDLSQMMDETLKRLESTSAAAASLESVSTQVQQVVRGYQV